MVHPYPCALDRQNGQIHPYMLCSGNRHSQQLHHYTLCFRVFTDKMDISTPILCVLEFRKQRRWTSPPLYLVFQSSRTRHDGQVHHGMVF